MSQLLGQTCQSPITPPPPPTVGMALATLAGNCLDNPGFVHNVYIRMGTSLVDVQRKYMMLTLPPQHPPSSPKQAQILIPHALTSECHRDQIMEPRLQVWNLHSVHHIRCKLAVKMVSVAYTALNHHSLTRCRPIVVSRNK